MEDARYDIRTLSRLAGVTSRTVHFYVQQGLLMPASSAGPGARYGEEHLLRLRLIRRLKARHLPLAEIRTRLAGMGPEDVAIALEEDDRRSSTPRPSTALDYIRGVFAEEKTGDSARASPSSPGRSQWDRIALATDVELHVRRPLTRETNRRVDRLIAAARDIFKEE